MVVDPYRWLENGNDPEVENWAAPPVRYNLIIRGGRLFYERETPPQPQSELIVFDGGSEDETIHVIDAIDGKPLADTLPHVGGGKSPVAITWDGDGKGFLHTQWPRNTDGSYATSGIRLFHHVLGTDASADKYVFGGGLSPKSEFHLAALVADGDGVHASVHLRRNGAPFSLVAAPDAGIGDSSDIDGAFVGNAFYAIARKHDSPGEVVALLPGAKFDAAKVIVPASPVVLSGIVPVRGGFITEDIDRGDSLARVFGVDGTLRHVIPVPKISAPRVAADPQGGPIIVRYRNYTTDNTWLAYDDETNMGRAAGFPVTATGDFSKIVVDRVFVASLDGKERIPLEIVHAGGIARDGTAPTVLYAYGAYGSASINPVLLVERSGQGHGIGSSFDQQVEELTETYAFFDSQLNIEGRNSPPSSGR